MVGDESLDEAAAKGTEDAAYLVLAEGHGHDLGNLFEILGGAGR